MMNSLKVYGWVILIGTFTFLSCGQGKGDMAASKSPENPGFASLDTSSIAIIPFEKARHLIFDKGYKPSTLSREEIKEIEVLLTNCVDKRNKNLKPEHRAYLFIDLTNKEYKRQYVAAINKKGEKEVWVNCFCNTFNINTDWRTTLVNVNDGGNCFFNLKVNLTKGQCYDFWVNGIA